MNCPVCKWPLRDHYKRIVYDHALNRPRMITRPGVIFSCQFCRDLYNTLGRNLNISYQEGTPICKPAK